MQKLDFGEGWLPEIREKLQEVAEEGAWRVKKGKRAVAVFDFDHTILYGDIGASFARYVAEELLLRYDCEEFWALIPEEFGRDRLYQEVNQLLDYNGDFHNAPNYSPFIEESLSLFNRFLEKDGYTAAIEWALRSYVGISELDMTTITRQVMARGWKFDAPLGDGAEEYSYKIKYNRGLRPYLEMCLTIRALESVGFEVWIISATNFWSVSTYAAEVGIDLDRVIGNRLEVEGGVLTDRSIKPILFGKGKKEAIKIYIGERPLVVFGDSMTDYDMLRHAKRLPILIDYGEPTILAAAKKHKWAIQPYHTFHLVESVDDIPREGRLFDPYDAPPLDEEELKHIHLERRQASNNEGD